MCIYIVCVLFNANHWFYRSLWVFCLLLHAWKFEWMTQFRLQTYCPVHPHTLYTDEISCFFEQINVPFVKFFCFPVLTFKGSLFIKQKKTKPQFDLSWRTMQKYTEFNEQRTKENEQTVQRRNMTGGS